MLDSLVLSPGISPMTTRDDWEYSSLQASPVMSRTASVDFAEHANTQGTAIFQSLDLQFPVGASNFQLWGAWPLQLATKLAKSEDMFNLQDDKKLQELIDHALDMSSIECSIRLLAPGNFAPLDSGEPALESLLISSSLLDDA
jgi:hypothetical protein